MATFQLELTPHAIATRRLFNDALEGGKWSPARLMVAKVFVENYGLALPGLQVYDMIVASHELSPRDEDGPEKVLKTLTTLCREKVLRSRMNGGKRLYEVNY